ncbi:hypothetical protein [Photobacterium nomapromontoriensis]|uniref:hypothetical protein n=1 Tax=Photobacterium nomapromontoriensis TaxID=2910237 RepID=UPI003D1302BC
MTNFQYFFHKLPCFNCKKTKVDTDLGWLTAAMKEEILEQVNVIVAEGNVAADFTVNVTCTAEEARDYLLLNYFGYSEEELESGVEAEDAEEVANEIAESLTAEGVIVFEHEIALQSCTDCGVFDDESEN